MKYLGIDFGEKRVGIAISDLNGKVAFPKVVLDNDKNLIKKVLEIIEKEKIAEVVIGESLNNKKERNKIMDKIDDFVGEVSLLLPIKINFENEFYTSSQAERITGKNKMIDASAASIILQSFLDKNK